MYASQTRPLPHDLRPESLGWIYGFDPAVVDLGSLLRGPNPIYENGSLVDVLNNFAVCLEAAADLMNNSAPIRHISVRSPKLAYFDEKLVLFFSPRKLYFISQLSPNPLPRSHIANQIASQYSNIKTSPGSMKERMLSQRSGN